MATATTAFVPLNLPQLPYALDALEPVISARTLSFHHDEHHRAYVVPICLSIRSQSLRPDSPIALASSIMRRRRGTTASTGVVSNPRAAVSHL